MLDQENARISIIFNFNKMLARYNGLGGVDRRRFAIHSDLPYMCYVARVVLGVSP